MGSILLSDLTGIEAPELHRSKFETRMMMVSKSIEGEGKGGGHLPCKVFPRSPHAIYFLPPEHTGPLSFYASVDRNGLAWVKICATFNSERPKKSAPPPFPERNLASDTQPMALKLQGGAGGKVCTAQQQQQQQQHQQQKLDPKAGLHGASEPAAALGRSKPNQTTKLDVFKEKPI